MHRLYKILLFVISLILIDQACKLWVHFNMEMRHAGEIKLIGGFFKLHYVLNPGMAFGLELNTVYGKLMLTLFRIMVSIAIFMYLRFLILKKSHNGLIICVAFVLAGALGNVVDSTFYGIFLGNAPQNSPMLLFNGQVIDMFLIDLGNLSFPSWLPILGGRSLSYPVFNLADVFIFFGAMVILFRQRTFFKFKKKRYKYLNTDYSEVEMLWLDNSVERPGDEHHHVENNVDNHNNTI